MIAETAAATKPPVAGLGALLGQTAKNEPAEKPGSAPSVPRTPCEQGRAVHGYARKSVSTVGTVRGDRSCHAAQASAPGASAGACVKACHGKRLHLLMRELLPLFLFRSMVAGDRNSVAMTRARGHAACRIDRSTGSRSTVVGGRGSKVAERKTNSMARRKNLSRECNISQNEIGIGEAVCRPRYVPQNELGCVCLRRHISQMECARGTPLRDGRAAPSACS
jgi:hypothetical protein